MLIKLVPKKDERFRVNKSVELYVFKRTCSKDTADVYEYEVVETVERTIYRLQSKNGNWIRYSNHYYSLHSKEEFAEIIDLAKHKKITSLNNKIIKLNFDVHKLTNILPFIFDDEMGSQA